MFFPCFLQENKDVFAKGGENDFYTTKCKDHVKGVMGRQFFMYTMYMYATVTNQVGYIIVRAR